MRKQNIFECSTTNPKFLFNPFNAIVSKIGKSKPVPCLFVVSEGTIIFCEYSQHIYQSNINFPAKLFESFEFNPTDQTEKLLTLQFDLKNFVKCLGLFIENKSQISITVTDNKKFELEIDSENQNTIITLGVISKSDDSDLPNLIEQFKNTNTDRCFSLHFESSILRNFFVFPFSSEAKVSSFALSYFDQENTLRIESKGSLGRVTSKLPLSQNSLKVNKIGPFTFEYYISSFSSFIEFLDLSDHVKFIFHENGFVSIFQALKPETTTPSMNFVSVEFVIRPNIEINLNE